jgi:CelD/BcsL family acetyltransferase involved in cellulose biosynthesis
VSLEGEAEPLLFGARRRDTLVAALPLARRGRTLVALMCEHSPRFDLMGDADALPQVWRAIAQDARWHVLELRAVPEHSPLVLELCALARGDGCAVVTRPYSRAPCFELEGFEDRLTSKFRGELRRAERQLGGIEYERVARFDRGALDELFAIEAAAWKGEAGTAIACEARLRRFYTTLARLAARRAQLTLAFVRAGGRRIAGAFCLEDARTLYLLKPGYLPDVARYSPGQLLTQAIALDARARGLARVDLLGHESDWKRKWTRDVTPHVTMTIYAPTPAGRARWVLREVARPRAAAIWKGIRARFVAHRRSWDPSVRSG